MDVAELPGGSAKRRDDPQFVCAVFARAAQERDPSTIGRPRRAVIVEGIGGQAQRRSAVDLLDVDVRIALLESIPCERHLVAVWRQRRVPFDARQGGERNSIQRRERRSVP